MHPIRVCVIGAGPSGLTAVKALKEQGVACDCYEKGSALGGNWRYGNDNGQSSAYRSLHINSSREIMAFSDFPMPAHYPDYPHHSQILEYFEAYAEHFGLREHIRFRAEVTSVSRNADGSFTVQLHTGETARYSHVMVCNGHHWSPRLPDPPFPGRFEGTVLHSHDYKTPEPYAGKRVVVLGFGNSAVDIACELSRLGGRTILASRSGAHIVPKFVFGIPVDKLDRPPVSYFPVWAKRMFLSAMLLIARGPQRNYGVPVPKRGLLHEHPTASSDLLNLAGHGRIVFKPNIARLEPDAVVFEDGSREPADVLIYATGYNIEFPFFDPQFIQAERNQLPLYHFAVHPEYRNLFFIGFVQPLGPIMPLAEVQAQWLSRVVSGAVQLPDSETMQRSIARDQAAIRQRYLDRPRHTIQVDFFPYRLRIRREMARQRVKGFQPRPAAAQTQLVP
ncbi:MAG: NAD(P)-binding domain-containing protein [Bacteroidia bacterium]|nr:NAD(P)-binding domain-containing protein [Bacteroidia bacterium]